MPTFRQQKLAQAMVENIGRDNPLNKQELVASVGYSEASADKKSKEILESKGVELALTELGFTEDAAKSVVSEILIGGENDTVKLKAADMIFKVHGSYAPEKHITVSVAVKPSEEDLALAAKLKELERDNTRESQ